MKKEKIMKDIFVFLSNDNENLGIFKIRIPKEKIPRNMDLINGLNAINYEPLENIRWNKIKEDTEAYVINKNFMEALNKEDLPAESFTLTEKSYRSFYLQIKPFFASDQLAEIRLENKA